VAIEQLARIPAYQTLADHLRREITSGALRPGDRLPTEPQLCAHTGLSRSTVREALRLLASQRLIVTTRGVNGGSFVAEPSPSQFGHLLSTGMQMLMTVGTVSAEQWFEVRDTFEVPAAGLAAVRRTQEHLGRLSEALFDPEESALDRITAAHRAFHLVLAEATGNPLYELITRPLYTLANETSIGRQAPAGFWQQVDLDHRLLLDAVTARDPIAARRAARLHLEHLRVGYAGAAVQVELG
jgi:GntR family transcriptional regulator, transcriptional repressor for pyruvate dehydrogenase complex